MKREPLPIVENRLAETIQTLEKLLADGQVASVEGHALPGILVFYRTAPGKWVYQAWADRLRVTQEMVDRDFNMCDEIDKYRTDGSI